MNAEDIPQSVVVAAYDAADAQFPSSAQSRWLMAATQGALAAALAEYERLGYHLIPLDGTGLRRIADRVGLRLVRNDEATVERRHEREQIESMIDGLEERLNDVGPLGRGYREALDDVREQMRLRFGPLTTVQGGEQ